MVFVCRFTGTTSDTKLVLYMEGARGRDSTGYVTIADREVLWEDFKFLSTGKYFYCTCVDSDKLKIQAILDMSEAGMGHNL